ncbi:MAG: segregation and condensation protein A [Christensenellaceae bacterium]|jgi:segregation and condensation protein A
MEKIQIKLEQFEGPLDLLLHLVKKAKIALEEIFVSEITEQYLTYMAEIGQVDMDRASDFLNMAALLLYIKSRALLPDKLSLYEDEAEGNPEEELIERLRVYQLYKEAGAQLKEFEQNAINVFYKLPEELFETESELVIEDADAHALHRAFLLLMKNARERKENYYDNVEIKQDSFSIRKQKQKITELLARKRRVSFFSIFSNEASQMEISVTFFALLELWNVNEVAVRQKKMFEDIEICAV